MYICMYVIMSCYVVSYVYISISCYVLTEWHALRSLGSESRASCLSCRYHSGGTTCPTLLVERRFSSDLANDVAPYGAP